jgi:AGZA family xanthine/uracil permease-like MFS transporter
MKCFALTQRQTTVPRDMVAGLTTFMASAYLVVVIPRLLSTGGMDQGAVTTATLVVMALGSLAMGLYANMPFVVGPGIGGSALLGVTLAQVEHVPWPAALGIAMASGVLFMVLTLTGARGLVMRLVPREIKIGLGASIGLFIALLGCRDAGMVAVNARTSALMLGDFTHAGPIMALVGLGVAIALQARNVPGAILVGIGAAAGLGVVLGVTHLPAAPLGLPPAVLPVLGHVDLSAALTIKALPYLFAYFVAEFFSTMGTTLAVGGKAGLLDAEGNLPGIERPFLIDAMAATFGPLVGIPGGTALVESAAGATAGGRSGLTAISAAACYALALLAIPLAMAIPKEATAPALILIGASMMGSLRNLSGERIEETLPPILMLLATLVAGSFGTGIAAGLVAHVAIHLLAGRWRQVPPGLALLAVPLAYYLFTTATAHH